LREEERDRFPEVFAAYEHFKRAVRHGMHPSPDRPFITVESADDLPIFADESEEHEYWGTHSVGDAWMDAAETDNSEKPLSARRPSRTNR
jgi:hypothetical protein